MKSIFFIKKHSMEMSTLVAYATSMLEELPLSEQQLAYEFIKRLVLAWDPNLTIAKTYFVERIHK